MINKNFIFGKNKSCSLSHPFVHELCELRFCKLLCLLYRKFRLENKLVPFHNSKNNNNTILIKSILVLIIHSTDLLPKILYAKFILWTKYGLFRSKALIQNDHVPSAWKNKDDNEQGCLKKHEEIQKRDNTHHFSLQNILLQLRKIISCNNYNLQ